MAESNEALNNEIPFEEHPLYATAMEQVASGDQAGATSSLRKLLDIYPDDKALRDLSVQAELRSAFATAKYVTTQRSQPVPFLRRVVLVLLVMMVIMVGITAFALAYRWIVEEFLTEREEDLYIESLQVSGLQRLEAGDWPGARETYQELLTAVPGDPTAEAAFEMIDQREAQDRLYHEAISAMWDGDWQTALDILYGMDPQYLAVEHLIEFSEGQEMLERTWQEAQGLFKAEDWQGAISALSTIRTKDIDFQRAQVEDLLHRACVQAAQELIAQANGDPDSLREAIAYLAQALALRPTRQDLKRQRDLANEYVAGTEAFAQRDWNSAIERWAPIYAADRDYQNGVLATNLRQACENSLDPDPTLCPP
jgi:tetratricopeptide (TPR) repeat protein